MASSSAKTIKVKCCDGVVLEVDEDLVVESLTMRCLMEEKQRESESESEKVMISLPEVTSEILCKVIEFLKKYEDPFADFRTWDKQFMKAEHDTIFDLILAGRYLQIESLVDLGCEAVANRMKGKSTKQIRETFNIKNDFTPEEEEENQRSPWFHKP
ncbi:hypothetical protein VNO77_12008 [Canavalia gladiata]|uniref:SKP1-like protein n=1 Tax=Canavalia gladiata TaxID=3824 RepID=A0AAN9LZD7_CANGL